MNVPKDILEIVEQVATSHADDIDRAVHEAERLVRASADFAEFQYQLLRANVRLLVHNARSAASRRIKIENGLYGGPAKVVTAESPNAAMMHGSLYSLRIGGSLLGLLTGDQLKMVSESERAISAGHLFNSLLCERLATMTPAHVTVREAVPYEKLLKIWEGVKNQMPFLEAG